MNIRASLGLSFALGLALAGCGPATTDSDLNAPKPGATSADPKTGPAASGGMGGDMTGKDGAAGSVPSPEPAANPGAAANPEATPKTSAVTLTADEIASINELADKDDAKVALAQMVCPVGEDEEGKPNHLGGMGKPIKEVVDGKPVFLCCKGCLSDFKADPKKYLSKLGK